jgi:cytidine deaminase
MNKSRIEEYRKKIDDVDQRIVKLLDQRQLIVDEIQKIKRQEGIDIEDEGREQKVINHVTSVLENEDLSPLVKDVWKQIFKDSKKMKNQKLQLMKVARKFREKAYAGYSGYKVGAAILVNNNIYGGCNVEVSGRSTSVHAEMLAAFKAVEDGHTNFDMLAVSPQNQTGEAPCGLCQHTLSEFCDELLIIEDVGKDDKFVEYKLSELIGPAYSASTRNKN